MRKVIYDNILKEGIKKLEGDTTEIAIELKEAFEKALALPEGDELNNVYARMDNFFGANMTDITLISKDELFRGPIV